jgi:hypothetical protein
MLSAARRKVERGRLRVVLIAVSFGLGGSSACVFWDSNDWSDKYGRSSGSDAASDESIVREGSADGGQEGGSEAGSSGEGGHIALVGSSTGSNVSSTSQFVSVAAVLAPDGGAAVLAPGDLLLAVVMYEPDPDAGGESGATAPGWTAAGNLPDPDGGFFTDWYYRFWDGGTESPSWSFQLPSPADVSAGAIVVYRGVASPSDLEGGSMPILCGTSSPYTCTTGGTSLHDGDELVVLYSLNATEAEAAWEAGSATPVADIGLVAIFDQSQATAGLGTQSATPNVPELTAAELFALSPSQ